MVSELKLSFSKIEKIAGGIVVVFVDGDIAVTAGAEAALPGVGDTVKRAAAADNFRGKALSFLDILAPVDLPVDRLVVVCLGKAEEAARTDWVKAGGSVLGRLPSAAKAACIILDAPGITVGADQAADFSTVLHIGIGGSDWGPRLAIQAFGGPSQRRQIRFVSNIDPTDVWEKTHDLDPTTTLFIVASKTFTTLETLTNARMARDWLWTALAGSGAIEDTEKDEVAIDAGRAGYARSAEEAAMHYVDDEDDS